MRAILVEGQAQAWQMLSQQVHPFQQVGIPKSPNRNPSVRSSSKYQKALGFSNRIPRIRRPAEPDTSENVIIVAGVDRPPAIMRRWRRWAGEDCGKDGGFSQG